MDRLLWVASLFLLMGCGTSDLSTPLGLQTTQELLVFSAPWCEACERVIPELDRRVTNLVEGGRIRTTGYLVTSQRIKDCPTPTEATQYQAHLRVQMPFQADPCPRMTYKKYFGDKQIQLPTAVILRNQQVFHKFEPGQFKVDEILFLLETP